jgi:hypothetical protein
LVQGSPHARRTADHGVLLRHLAAALSFRDNPRPRNDGLDQTGGDLFRSSAGGAGVEEREILAAFILVVYLRYMGLTIPTYESARVFKGVASKANVSLNAIGFGSVFA